MEIFIIKEGICWWRKSLSLVGNLEELVGKTPTSLLVKKCPRKLAVNSIMVKCSLSPVIKVAISDDSGSEYEFG